STVTPSTDPTMGSATVTAGSDAVSGPARNADCSQAVAASPSTAQTYSSGVRSNAGMPWPSWSTTPLDKTENRPHSEPDISPSNSALTQPEDRRAPITHRIRHGPMTKATIIHVRTDPRGVPAWGLPTVTTTVTAATSSTAQIPCQR